MANLKNDKSYRTRLPEWMIKGIKAHASLINVSENDVVKFALNEFLRGNDGR